MHLTFKRVSQDVMFIKLLFVLYYRKRLWNDNILSSSIGTMSLFRKYLSLAGLSLLSFTVLLWRYDYLSPENDKIETHQGQVTEVDHFSEVDDVNPMEDLVEQTMEEKDIEQRKDVKDPPNEDFYHVPNSKIYIYSVSAFLIIRRKQHTVILVGFIGKNLHSYKFICTFLFNSTKEITRAHGKVVWMKITSYQHDFKYLPVFYMCPVKGAGFPQKVIISTSSNIENHKSIKVLNRLKHKMPAKDGIAVCVKTMYNMTSPEWFTEWMEMQRIMGANKVIIYGEKHTGKDVKKLVEYYQGLGFLHLQTWNLGWNSSSHPKFGGTIHTQGQFASNNDCLYRFGYLYRYMVYIDLDELIVPTRATSSRTYKDIISLYSHQHPDTFYFRHVCFCTTYYVQQNQKFKSLLSTHTNIYRKEPNIPIEFEQKAIIKPSSIAMYGVHGPHARFKKKNSKYVSARVAKLHHYRYRENQNCSVRDTSMSFYYNNLRKRVSYVLKSNGFK